MVDLTSIVKRVPVVGALAEACARWIRGTPRTPPPTFSGSRSYWEDRYAGGGTSGCGSYGRFAEFKADVLNAFVETHDVESVVEFGCGDGNQLTLARYPRYVGLDVSQTAVDRCRRRFHGSRDKEFHRCDPSDAGGRQRIAQAQLSLSLDVIYHLVEDAVFEQYMRDLFAAATRFVIIYSSNTDENPPGPTIYIRHRRFTNWVEAHAEDWRLMERIPNRFPYKGDYRTGSFSDFYLYCLSASVGG